TSGSGSGHARFFESHGHALSLLFEQVRTENRYTLFLELLSLRPVDFPARPRRPAPITRGDRRLRGRNSDLGGIEDGLVEILVLFAARAAERLDGGELFLGQVNTTLHDVGLAQILAYLRIFRIEFDGLQIIGDAFVRAPELTRRIAAIVQ